MRSFPIALVAAGALAAGASGAAPAPTVVAKIRVAPATSPCAAKIDPKTNKVVRKIGVGNGACGLGFGAGSLWVEDTSSNTVSRVSAATGKRTAAVKVGLQPYDATFAFGAAWATSYGSGEVDRIDPHRNRVVKRFPLGSSIGVVGAFGSIWATGDKGVLRIDPATNKVVATIPVESAGWTAASDDAIWITAPSRLVRIDPATNTVAATIKLASSTIGDPAVVAGQVWVPLIRENAVAVVDPSTNAVAQTVKVGTGPFVVTEIAGEAWVPSWKGTDIWRLKP
jgi:YVTN family beta-propeller protein